MFQLIEDLERLHEDSNIHLNDIDAKVIKSISAVEKRTMALEPHLSKLRIELWLKYIEKVNNETEKFLIDLSSRFVKVKEYRTRLSKINRGLKRVKDKLNYEKYNLPKHSASLETLFKESIELWNELVDSENDLKNEGWIKFLTLIYLPFAVIFSGGYWFVVSSEKFGSYFNFNDSIFWFIIILIVLYFFLKYLSQKQVKKKEHEEEL
jgi:hypothetical protein